MGIDEDEEVNDGQYYSPMSLNKFEFPIQSTDSNHSGSNKRDSGDSAITMISISEGSLVHSTNNNEDKKRKSLSRRRISSTFKKIFNPKSENAIDGDGKKGRKRKVKTSKSSKSVNRVTRHRATSEVKHGHDQKQRIEHKRGGSNRIFS